ncbi:hypothetical protein [Hyphomicrobium sp. LHD-15]|uniref:hypothetical protein n=1 Tax=Hyphomicrobium sp. LHD-15 TaxID=3072142 RepID=UPI00280D0C45|nr:hypothetical protein [Hyphomicrobium sp. LHD-15]MDQ8700689.1 hypothetical protein [Hyphomicrobium sp. LHD-15]
MKVLAMRSDVPTVKDGFVVDLPNGAYHHPNFRLTPHSSPSRIDLEFIQRFPNSFQKTKNRSIFSALSQILADPAEDIPPNRQRKTREHMRSSIDKHCPDRLGSWLIWVLPIARHFITKTAKPHVHGTPWRFRR